MDRINTQQKLEAERILRAAQHPQTAQRLTKRQVINALRCILRVYEEAHPTAAILGVCGAQMTESAPGFAQKTLKGEFPALAGLIDHAATENACEDIINESNNGK